MKNNFDFILFGATGDLASRMILPALYDAQSDDLLHKDFRIIATGRSKLSNAEFIEKLREKINIDDFSKWDEFVKRIIYVDIDINSLDDFLKLKNILRNDILSIIYFSVSPSFFIKCCENLSKLNMNDDNKIIVLEKPLGMSLNECKSINTEIAKHYKEEQIYRIDHYLGKRMVKELFDMRKTNKELDELINQATRIELSAKECLGVLNRGEFYDTCGALRDMLQNHLLQMLSLLLIDTSASDLRKAKSEFFKSLARFSKEDLKNNVIKAQYTQNLDSKSYKDELNVSPNSRTETFVCVKTTLDKGRFKGVPIYLRTGKRMSEKITYFTIFLKNSNYLKIVISPTEEIKLYSSNDELIKSYEPSFKEDKKLKAYARIILRLISKDLNFFNEKEELESAWEWVQPIIDFDDFAMYEYKAYTDGINNSEFKK